MASRRPTALRSRPIATELSGIASTAMVLGTKPWVVAYTFRIKMQNIDQIAREA
jgi:hypothetical protein